MVWPKAIPLSGAYCSLLTKHIKHSITKVQNISKYQKVTLGLITSGNNKQMIALAKTLVFYL